MTFGQRLRAARKEKQLTQKELAVKIKAAHNSISNWENDQNMPDPDTIQNLCWALDVQPNYFFDVDTHNLPESPQLLPPVFTLKPGEEQMIRKFRALDDRGKAAVLTILNHEYESQAGENTNTPAKEA